MEKKIDRADMENKINIAELLKDCPKGMELDCINYNGVVTFEEIFNCPDYPIKISVKYDNKYFTHTLTKYGQTCISPYNKCIIFPKGKTTWEGFQRPFKDEDVIYNKGINALAIFYKQTDNSTISHCFLNTMGELKISHYHTKDLSDWRFATKEEKQKLFKAIKDNGYWWNPETKTLDKLVVPKFKDGDIISDSLGTCIFKGEGTIKGTVDYYCGVHSDYFNIKQKPDGHYGDIADYRLATKEEKEKLFKAINDNGYKWNSETKTLEKLVEPKFKVGDVIQDKDSYKVKIINVCVEDEMYEYESAIAKGIGGIVFDEQDDWELVPVEPKFKVGDRIKQIGNPKCFIIKTIEFDRYVLNNNQFIRFGDEHLYELVPNKFDINTLVPFESRVLARDGNTEKWKPSFWGFYDIDIPMVYPYECCGASFAQCIPYKGNEHLLGTTDDCEEFFKTWKE